MPRAFWFRISLICFYPAHYGKSFCSSEYNLGPANTRHLSQYLSGSVQSESSSREPKMQSTSVKCVNFDRAARGGGSSAILYLRVDLHVGGEGPLTYFQIVSESL